MPKIIGGILFLLALSIYLFAPTHYDLNYSIVCTIIYLLSIIIYLLIRKKTNYFDFDCIFFLTYYFVTLYYSVFMYESDPYRYFMFRYQFDANLIPQASGLALLGMNGFLCGALFHMGRENIWKKMNYHKIISSNPLYFLAILLFLLYILTGGYSSLKSAYYGGTTESLGISKYIFALCPAALVSGIIINFVNINQRINNGIRKIPVLSIVTILLLVGMIVETGSRTIPLQIILLVIGFYTMYHPVSLLKFYVFVLVGMLFFALLGSIRSKDIVKSRKMEDLAMDLIINNRSSFFAIDYVDKHGVSYGSTMLSSFLAPIPLFQGAVVHCFKIEPQDMSSSVLITVQTLGSKNSRLGLGTNILADLYIAFGIIGVLVFMTFLGYFVSFVKDKSQTNIYALTIYGVLLTYSVFLVRAEFFVPFRLIIWSILLVYISTHIKFYRYKIFSR